MLIYMWNIIVLVILKINASKMYYMVLNTIQFTHHYLLNVDKLYVL